MLIGCSISSKSDVIFRLPAFTADFISSVYRCLSVCSIEYAQKNLSAHIDANLPNGKQPHPRTHATETKSNNERNEIIRKKQKTFKKS